MMKIVIEIEVENDSFQVAPSHEMHKIFQKVRDGALAAMSDGKEIREKPIQDLNGNTIGHFSVIN